MSTDAARETSRPLVKVTWFVEIGEGEHTRTIPLTTHVHDSPLATDEALRGKAREQLKDEAPDGRWCYAEVER